MDFLHELQDIVTSCHPAPNTLFRLAIEETEAWYLGDRNALLRAYPRAKRHVLDRYVQDSRCNTWELLADAVYPGGAAAAQKTGGMTPGDLKHEWAGKIGPFLDIHGNASPSFNKLVEGFERLTEQA